MIKVCYECGEDLSDKPNAITCTLCDAILLLQIQGFPRQYEALEYLHSGKQSDTFVVKNRNSGEYLLAKFYQKSADTYNDEESILSQLDHPAIPKIVESIKTEETVCIIRNYFKGASLDRLSYSPDEAHVVDIGIQICDILTYLHSRTPSVIHRDIKPQNVILGDDGIVYLIDFGISRRFSDDALKDTESIGTEGFMPPEQYGFKQTDCRADIYSTGVLLCWLLTGKKDPDLLVAPVNKGLTDVIKKCTAFAPENRYSSADEVKKALLEIGYDTMLPDP